MSRSHWPAPNFAILSEIVTKWDLRRHVDVTDCPFLRHPPQSRREAHDSLGITAQNCAVPSLPLNVYFIKILTGFRNCGSTLRNKRNIDKSMRHHVCSWYIIAQGLPVDLILFYALSW